MPMACAKTRSRVRMAAGIAATLGCGGARRRRHRREPPGNPTAASDDRGSAVDVGICWRYMFAHAVGLDHR